MSQDPSTNDRIDSLLGLTQAIGTIRSPVALLEAVAPELAASMAVKGISIKLLSEDRKFLSYAALLGLPAALKEKQIEVARSPLNRRILEGEAHVTGDVSLDSELQFREELASAGIQSLLLVPMTIDNSIKGILGAYCVQKGRFSEEDVDFFRLAANITAMALENARAYDSIEQLIKDRTWFMMRMAHNLRSPLAAIVSMADVVRGGHLGDLNPAQQEHLRRIHRRALTMIAMVGELLTLARGRSENLREKFTVIDLPRLAVRIRRTFEDRAADKHLDFQVICLPGLPGILGDPDLLEQALENLVSNAVKYTPEAGRVRMEIMEGRGRQVCFRIEDSGIGISKEEMPRLFTEFFRAVNARQMVEDGTGLGLAAVREIATLHGGAVTAESRLGQGSVFILSIPCHEKNGGPSSHA